MSDILAAEWLKLRTGRPIRYALGVTVMFALLMLGIALSFVATWDGLEPDARAHASMGSLPQLYGWIATLCMSAFGAVAVTTEHSSGLVETTYLAMPARPRVIAAKAILVAIVSFVASLVAIALVFAGAAFIVGDRIINGQEPVTPSSLVLAVALALSTSASAMVGLGLGAVSRSALAAVVGLMLLWYIAPLLAAQAPEPWGAWVGSILPGALAGEIAGTGNANSVIGAHLSAPLALGVLVVYGVVPIVAAMAAARERDV